MDLKALFPNPDFRKVCISPTIDFIRVFSPGPTKIARPDRRYREARYEFAGEGGTAITIQDPKREDVEFMARRVADGRMLAVETSIDLYPRGALSTVARHQALRGLRDWLLTRLYPWKGPGLQPGNRMSRALGDSEVVFNDDEGIRRRPRNDETLYLGHAKERYANPSLPNFAFVRVYIKTTDHGGKPIPEADWRTRVEVNLNPAGCRHFGLLKASDLIGFKFRRLGRYFLLAKLRIATPGMARLQRKNSALAAVLKSHRTNLPVKIISQVGMHGLVDADPSVVRSITADGPSNERFLVALDNLSRHFRTGVPATT